MMSCPDRDTRCIQHRGNIMRVNIFQIERNQSDLPFPGSVDRYSVDFRQTLDRIGCQLHLMTMDFIHTDLLQEIDSCRQSNGSGNNGSTPLKFVGKLFPGRFVQSYIVDHFSAVFDRFHGLKQTLLTI
ncbi:hypothetical protein D3C77_562900 [compost metagenome]